MSRRRLLDEALAVVFQCDLCDDWTYRGYEALRGRHEKAASAHPKRSNF